MFLGKIHKNANDNINKNNGKNNHADINIKRFSVFYNFVISILFQNKAPLYLQRPITPKSYKKAQAPQLALLCNL